MAAPVSPISGMRASANIGATPPRRSRLNRESNMSRILMNVAGRLPRRFLDSVESVRYFPSLPVNGSVTMSGWAAIWKAALRQHDGLRREYTLELAGGPDVVEHVRCAG